jgi:hypothetical protein
MLVVIVVAVVVLLALGALYTYVKRDNPMQGRLDAEREETAEELPLRGPTDFQSDLRPPRDPAP